MQGKQEMKENIQYIFDRYKRLTLETVNNSRLNVDRKKRMINTLLMQFNDLLSETIKVMY